MTKMRPPNTKVQLLKTFNPSNSRKSKRMNTHIISFKNDGSAHCLWTEALPLHEIGKLKITRASTIEFNNTNQRWEVKDGKKKIRFFAKSRALCLAWEHQQFNR
jgi:hypothetical protein